MDAEQHKESEREQIMPGRERGIVVEGRVVGSEKERRGRGEEWECVLDCIFYVCLFVCFFPLHMGNLWQLISAMEYKG